MERATRPMHYYAVTIQGGPVRRPIRIGRLARATALALLAVLGASLMVTLPRYRTYAPSGPVQVSFAVAPAVSAERLGDTLVVRTNVPWTATAISSPRPGVQVTTVFSGPKTGSKGRRIRAVGRLVSFTVVPQR
jgi:hypothetical protein